MEIKKHWDNLASNWSILTHESHPFIMSDEDLSVFNKFNTQDVKRILVLGATLKFKQFGRDDQTIVFADISQKMLNHLVGMETICSDWAELTNIIDEPFDLILGCGSFNVFGKAKQTKNLFKIAKGHLSPKGSLVIRYFDKKSILTLVDDFKYSPLFKTTPLDQVDYQMAENVFYNFCYLDDYTKKSQDFFNFIQVNKSQSGLFPIVSFTNV